MNFMEEGKQYRRSFAVLPRFWKIGIVWISMVSLGALTIWCGFLARNYFLNSAGPLAFMGEILAGRLDPTSPIALQKLTDLMVVLLLVFIFLMADTVMNIFVLVYAMRRKKYPAPHDRELWLMGLWAAFVLVQAPTGFPSALAYWLFIAIPARRMKSAAAATELVGDSNPVPNG